MSKRQKSEITAFDVDGASSVMLQEIIALVRQETGDPTVATFGESLKFIIGIPLPALALEYAFCNTVLPLEKIIQIYGPSGIGKSGLAFEIIRWFMAYHALAFYLEVESKYNADWALSITGRQFENRVVAIPCDAIDGPSGWQTNMTRTSDWAKKKMLPDKGQAIGKRFPVVWVVDSLVGKTTMETVKKVRLDGSAGRGAPTEALSISKYLKFMNSVVRRWPFVVITVNHEKKNTGGIMDASQARYGAPMPGSMPKSSRPGGKAVDFHGSMELALTKIKRIENAAFEGNRLKIKIEKNSYGPDKREIFVNVLWCNEPTQLPDGRAFYQQRTVWDWNGATIDLLFSLEGEQEKRMKQITGLVKDGETRCHSTILGIPASAPQPNSYVGEALRRQPQMMEDLRDLLGICRRKVFTNNFSYDQQMLMLKEEVEAAVNAGGGNV